MAGLERVGGPAARMRRLMARLREVKPEDDVGPRLPHHVRVSREAERAHLNVARAIQRKREVKEAHVREHGSLEAAARALDDEAHEDALERAAHMVERVDARPNSLGGETAVFAPGVLPHVVGAGEQRFDIEAREQRARGLDPGAPGVRFQQWLEQQGLEVGFDNDTATPDRLIRKPDLPGRWMRTVKCAVPWCSAKTQVLMDPADAKMLSEVGRDCGEANEWSAYWAAVDELIPVLDRICGTCWAESSPTPPVRKDAAAKPVLTVSRKPAPRGPPVW